MKEYDLYIVPTPIGNLDDITLRALDVLKSVDIIACEDKRVTQKLLNHYDIKTRCVAYHKFNEREMVGSILELLNQGKKIALVSDAGTPLFCDPGAVLVKDVKDNGFSVTSLAGANAVATFLSQVPRNSEEFRFVGFLPRTKSQLIEVFNKSKNSDIVFYESPNRILTSLKILQEIYPKSKVAIGRELTKIFEEVYINYTHMVIEYFEKTPVKGEIVGLIYRQENFENKSDFDEQIQILKDRGFKAKEIAIIVSALYGANKNSIYEQVLRK